MSNQEDRPPAAPPAVTQAPGAAGSVYESPNTRKGTPKKAAKEIVAERTATTEEDKNA